MTPSTTTILIVDDDASVRATLVAYLEDCDYRVIDCSNGFEALALIRKLQPDIVITDLRMPHMDGIALLKETLAEFPNLPVIMLSGLGGVHEVVESLKLGAWDYLTKPIERMDLLDLAIEDALEKAHLKKQEASQRKELEETNAALKRALRQLQEDEEAGRRLQFQLLPEDHFQFEGLEFSRTLLTPSNLSGDFVDYFELSDHQVGFYIADVSGHGVSSAFVTVLLKSYMTRYLALFRTGKNNALLDPAKILKRLNANIIDSKTGKYLTIFYGVIDTAKKTLIWSNGGQFPLPVLFDGQDTRFIGEKSKPIGLFDFSEYQNEELQLPASFSILLSSDGILDTLNQEHMDEKQAVLLAKVKENGMQSLDHFMELLHIEEQIPLDDVTILQIRCVTE